LGFIHIIFIISLLHLIPHLNNDIVVNFNFNTTKQTCYGLFIHWNWSTLPCNHTKGIMVGNKTTINIKFSVFLDSMLIFVSYNPKHNKNMKEKDSKERTRLIPSIFHYLCSVVAPSLGRANSHMRSCILVKHK